MLEGWTRAVIRFRILVLACWLAIAIVGALSAVQLPSLLSTSLAVPGTSSQRADTILAQHFRENPEGTFTVVFDVNAHSGQTIRGLTHRLDLAARKLPGARVNSLRRVLGVVYGDVVTSLDIQRAQRYTEILRRALSANRTANAYVTGPPAIQYDLNPILADDLRHGELLAFPIVLITLVLILGLRGVLIVPFVFAGCTITATLAIVFVIAHAVLMVSYVPNLVELVGLGLAVDYSLLIVQRFREEIAGETSSVDDAIVRTMATAGRSVILSGVAVAIGLSAVLIMPVPFIRSMGIAGVVVPLVSIAAALTIQPALLSLLGRPGVRSMAPGTAGRMPSTGSVFWAGLARTVMDRRLIVLGGGAVLMAVLIAPVARLQLTPGSISGIPQSMESARGLTLLREHVGLGAITPIEVVLDGGAPRSALTAATSAATLRLGRELLQDPAAYLIDIGTSSAPYVDPTGRYRRMFVYPRDEFGAEASQQLVTKLRQQFIPAAHFPSGMRVSTGGAPAQGVDFLAEVYGTFPWVILAVLVVTYLVLLRAFRSLILPLVALLLDAVSVAAAYGMLVVVFRFGIGADLVRPLGISFYQASQIEGWIPVFLFAMLFGLSMDYQVFLVTRMREAWDRGATDTGAVAYGIERTGGIVTAAAVIMVASFSGFMAGRVAGLQEFGAGLALGVLLDATVVRILLLPSMMTILGRWCWWLPSPIARLLYVKASPLAGSETRGQP